MASKRLRDVKESILTLLKAYNAQVKVTYPYESAIDLYISINDGQELCIKLGDIGDDEIYVMFPKEVEFMKSDNLPLIQHISPKDNINEFINILDKYIIDFTKDKVKYVNAIVELKSQLCYSHIHIYYDKKSNKSFAKNSENGRILVMIPNDDFTSITIGDMYNFNNPVEIDTNVDELFTAIYEAILFFK